MFSVVLDVTQEQNVAISTVTNESLSKLALLLSTAVFGQASLEFSDTITARTTNEVAAYFSKVIARSSSEC